MWIKELISVQFYSWKGMKKSALEIDKYTSDWYCESKCVTTSITVKLNTQANEKSTENNFPTWWKVAFLFFVIHILKSLNSINVYINININNFPKVVHIIDVLLLLELHK